MLRTLWIVAKWLFVVALASLDWLLMSIVSAILIDHFDRTCSYLHGYRYEEAFRGTFNGIALRCTNSDFAFFGVWFVLVVSGIVLAAIEWTGGKSRAAGYLAVAAVGSLTFWLFLLLWLIPWW